MHFTLGFLLFSGLMASCSDQTARQLLTQPVQNGGVSQDTGLVMDLPLRFDSDNSLGSRRALTAGEHHSCVLRDGAVYCWGYGLAGQLGQGDTGNGARPSMIAALGHDNQSVFAGDLHSCAIKQNGAVYCWGYNQTGAVGNGRSGREYSFSGQAKLFNVTVPSQVQGLDGLKLVQIAATKITSCGLTDTGAVYCWGSGANYELGDGQKDNSQTRYAHHSGSAQLVTVLDEPALSIHAGDRAFCVVTNSHKIRCWGTLTLPTEKSYPVVDISSAAMPISLAMADQHSCLVTESHELFCIGDNWYQQTGLSQVANVWTRVPAESFTQISTARKTSCGITPEKSVRCWGVCLHGLCGSQFTAKLISPHQAQNVFAYTTSRSIEIEGIRGAIDIAVGARHACALLDNGQIQCWGNGFLGELGDGESQSSSDPVTVNFEN